jgi:hypothetical protein
MDIYMSNMPFLDNPIVNEHASMLYISIGDMSQKQQLGLTT